jgi:hypothetical protein
MSIANELTCDVAAAVLAQQAATPHATSPTDLMELMLAFHTTLRQLTGADRRRRHHKHLNNLASPPASKATTANN